MAHILPETPPQTLPGEVLKTFRALKALPDSFFVWHHLAPWQPNAPDFLILSQDGRALLVKVSAAPADQAAAAQMLLLADERPALGVVENSVLAAFLQSLQLPDAIHIETLIVFANIPHQRLTASRPGRPAGEAQWAGRELLQSETRLTWEKFFPAQPVETLWLEKMRQRFTPEVVVPAEMTVRPPVARRLKAGLSDYLLDYDQEAAVKADLSDIESEGQALGGDFRLSIINGVAGSGKTLILLYRLRLLYHLYPQKRFLVLTHNRPLCHDMQGRFARLEGDLPPNIEWRTFNAWCYHHWPATDRWIDPLPLQRRTQIAQQVWQNTLSGTALTAHMLLSEIDWLKDQLPLSKEAYLSADRRGRGFGLNAEQRRRMWTAIQTYQQTLAQSGELDWGDVPQRLWRFVQEKQLVLPWYDIVLVDEAQFFAPLWMALIRQVLHPPNAHLFLVADPTQGFLGRRASWKSLGLEARGRTQQLRRSYRTTREIMEFATIFYRLRLGEEKDEDVVFPDLLNMPNGVFPQIIQLDSPQDEISRVANEAAAFVRQGCPRRHLLLLHANGQGVRALIQALKYRLGKSAVMDPKDTYPGDYIRVTTLNAGAGLESPIVFVVGLRELFEEEQSLRLSDEERVATIRDNTRKIYMAATRAGQRLVLTYTGTLPEQLRQIFAAPR